MVREFAQHGAWIGSACLRTRRLGSSTPGSQSRGGRALVLPIDLSDAEEVEAAVQRVEEGFGPIDIWVNGAMASMFWPINQDDGSGVGAPHPVYVSGIRVRDF